MTRIVRASRVLLAALIATLAVWLGLSQAATAAPARPLPAAMVGYDRPQHTSVPTYATTERGPPVAHDHSWGLFAVDAWSRGASVCGTGAETGPTTTYTTPAMVVSVAWGTGTAQMRAQSNAGAPSSLALSDTAAKTEARACSFAGTTTVLMADGSRKPIEDIEVGDEVIATDPETGEQEAKTVEHVFVHDDTVIDLVVDGEVITTTEDHPFRLVAQSLANELEPLLRGST